MFQTSNPTRKKQQIDIFSYAKYVLKSNLLLILYTIVFVLVLVCSIKNTMSATSVKHKIALVFKMASKKAVKIYNSENETHMPLDFCLETNMLKLSYKHLELSFHCYFHVFSIVKTTLLLT